MLRSREITEENPLFGATNANAVFNVVNNQDNQHGNALVENSGIRFNVEIEGLNNISHRDFLVTAQVGGANNPTFNSLASLIDGMNSSIDMLGSFMQGNRLYVHANGLGNVEAEDINESGLTEALGFEFVQDDVINNIMGEVQIVQVQN